MILESVPEVWGDVTYTSEPRFNLETVLTFQVDTNNQRPPGSSGCEPNGRSVSSRDRCSCFLLLLECPSPSIVWLSPINLFELVSEIPLSYCHNTEPYSTIIIIHRSDFLVDHELLASSSVLSFRIWRTDLKMIDTKVLSKTVILWYTRSSLAGTTTLESGNGILGWYILKLNEKNEDLEIVLENSGSVKVSDTLCHVQQVFSIQMSTYSRNQGTAKKKCTGSGIRGAWLLFCSQITLDMLHLLPGPQIPLL